MTKDILKYLTVFLGISLLLICLVGGVVSYLASSAPSPSPMVVIHTPQQGQLVTVGEVISVQSTSKDETNHVARVELWETDGEYIRLIQTDEPLEETGSFSVPQGWQPLSSGAYRLIVRAYNDQDVPGQALVEVQAVERTEAMEVTESMAAGEGIPPAPGGYPSDEIPTEAEVPAEGALDPPNPDPEPPQWGPGDLFANLITSTALDIVNLPLPLPPTPVEFEALDLEIEEKFDTVYCYASLADEPVERVPESGSIDSAGQRHWDIAEYLGGNNRVTVLMPVLQPLHVWAECLGWYGDQYYSIGILDMTHPPEQWNGQVIEATGTGGRGGFRLKYRINPVSAPFPAPYNLQQIVWGERSYLNWAWDGDPAEIDCFFIFRNGTLVASVSPELRLYQMTPWWSVPPCSEEYEYHVVAHRGGCGGEVSSPSNFLRFYGAPCGTQNDIIRMIPVPICSGAGMRVGVRYLHQAPSGPAWIGTRVFSNGRMIPDIWSTYTRIEHGEGAVLLALTNHANYGLTTDQIAVFMYDENGQDFYIETFNRTIQWQAAKPDLTIESARVESDSQVLVANVRNNGCAPVGSTEIEFLGEAGLNASGRISNIGGRETAVWKHQLAQGAVALWGEGFKATVDPLNEVEESDEFNNTYTVGPARLRRVHFYKVVIHNDHEPRYRGKGEFEILFSARGIRNGEALENGYVWRSYHWGKGEHAMNLSISPILLSGDDLAIRVAGYESDCQGAEVGSPDEIGDVYYTHSHDGTQEGSWKGGGEFSATSDMGDYTVYWRLVLAE